MMTGWEGDKRWSDQFLRQIKGHIGQALICAAPEVDDQEKNTDLIVFKLDAIRIACRVRRHQYQSYAGEFTLRAGRPSGNKTELIKVIEGWGNYIFYGYANQEETEVEKWFIGDLSRFRHWHTRELIRGKGRLPGVEKKNGDGSSWFYVYNSAVIPGFVIASDFKAVIQEASKKRQDQAKEFTGIDDWLNDYSANFNHREAA